MTEWKEGRLYRITNIPKHASGLQQDTKVKLQKKLAKQINFMS